MAVDELIDDRISLRQIQRAVKALHDHESKKQKLREEKELLTGREPNIWLNVTVKQVAPKNKIRPVKIPIAHPLVDPRTTSICLITKDPQREYKDLLEQHNIKFISRVIGIAKLKGKFKPFEARRMLLKDNGLFLADERVVPLLPKLLGTKWFEAKKQPLPVCLTRKDLKGELERAVCSTYMHQNNGTCTSIKIGTLSQKPEQIVANIRKAIPDVAAHIPAGWDNIQSFFVKTNTSLALPIWNCNLGTGEEGRWSGLVKEGEEEGRKETDSDEEGDQNKATLKDQKRTVADSKSKAKQDGTVKKKKRTSEENDDDEPEDKPQPRKKAKRNVLSANPPITASPSAPKSSKAETTNVSTQSSKPKSKAPETPNTSTDQAHLKSKSGQPLSSQKRQKEKDSEPAALNASNADQTGKREAKKLEPQTRKNDVPSKAKKSDQKPVSGLTKDEMRKKRAGMSLLERKKEKLMAVKGGKSTKSKVLKKRVLDG